MAVNWLEEWAEMSGLFFMVLGFILSILLMIPVLSYISIMIAGFLAGRIYYIKRFSQPILPFIIMICGFLLGYLIGGFWVSRFWILILFGVTFGASYYLHLKKILVIFKSRNFVK
jgi:hypothetical protein